MIEARFSEKYIPEPNSGCWLWTGAISNRGYGQIRQSTAKLLLAHRVSYELHKGAIPTGLCVLHKCDNPICVNPEHLSVGTHKQNMEDMAAKKRSGAPRGEMASKAKLTAAQVIDIKADGRASRVVAAAYGISHTAVLAVRRGKSWGSIKK